MIKKTVVGLMIIFVVGLWFGFNEPNGGLSDQLVYDKVLGKLWSCRGYSKYSGQLLSEGITEKEIIIASFNFVKKMTEQQGKQFKFTLPDELVVKNLNVLDPLLFHMAGIEAINITKENLDWLDKIDLTADEKENFKRLLLKSGDIISDYYRNFYQQDFDTILLLIGIKRV